MFHSDGISLHHQTLCREAERLVFPDTDNPFEAISDQMNIK